MNERIKLLESQCWTQIPCDFDMRAGGSSTVRTVFDREKFARLIIDHATECVRSVLRDENSDLSYAGCNQVQREIKEYFGVEE